MLPAGLYLRSQPWARVGAAAYLLLLHLFLLSCAAHRHRGGIITAAAP